MTTQTNELAVRNSSDRNTHNTKDGSVTIPILHFNDVYRVQPQKLAGGIVIDVTQFAYMVNALRAAWPLRRPKTASGDVDEKEREGLVLFSGDLFSPSVESSVTRGSHMVPVINELKPDVAVAGNHEFDFGYPHLTKLLKDTHFPWLLSNIVDSDTGKVPEGLHEIHVMERCGVRIGFIGLVEEEWIATVSAWPSNFHYRDMAEVAMKLSQVLRDPQGQYKCDIVIALTHCRLPNDIQLAKATHCLTPAFQTSDHALLHGVDLILGGHDHFYYAPRGADSWEGYNHNKTRLGSDEDKGDVLVVKSGTDFRGLSELNIELCDAAPGSVRRKIIKSVKGKRHWTDPNGSSCEDLKEVLSKTLEYVSKAMKEPVCVAADQLDLRSKFIRTAESATGNWFADVVRHAYDDSLNAMNVEEVDGVFLCAGALRGDTTYGPGKILLGDILEILPFDDCLVVLELDGETIWQAFEVGFSAWPATEGRFPVTSGFRVVWDSTKEPGQRVVAIEVEVKKPITSPEREDQLEDSLVQYETVKRERGGKKYIVMTRKYMSDGNDGFECFKGEKHIIDDTLGQTMSSIVRKYLLGLTFINKHAQSESDSDQSYPQLLDSETGKIIEEVVEANEKTERVIKGDVISVEDLPDIDSRGPLTVATHEHMSEVDVIDGKSVRTGSVLETDVNFKDETALPTIYPIHDGRMKDLGSVMA